MPNVIRLKWNPVDFVRCQDVCGGESHGTRAMKHEYDFTDAEQGKFYGKDATFNLPIYLDDDTRALAEEIAERKHSDVTTVVNELIRSGGSISK